MGAKLTFSEPVFLAYPPATDAAQTFVINKARTHKYTSRERVGNRWVYTYAEPQTPHVSKPAPAAEPAAPVSNSKSTPEQPWTDVAIHAALDNYPKESFEVYWRPDSDKLQADIDQTAHFYDLGFQQLKEAANNVPAGASWNDANSRMLSAMRALIGDANRIGASSAARGLIKYTNSQFASKAKKSANAAPQYLEIKSNEAGLTQEAKLEAAKLYIAGKSLDLAVGGAKDKQEGGTGQVSLADVYTRRSTRVGPDDLQLSTPQQAQSVLVGAMKMRDISLGRALTDDEKAHHLKQCALAFNDMTKVLGLPEEMGSFNGRLSLDISSTGRDTTLATYSPANQLITLRRDSGAGSLAHEWGHFFDHIVGRLSDSYRTYVSQHANSVASNPLSIEGDKTTATPKGAMEALYASPDMKAYVARLKGSDEYRKASRTRKAYLASPEEVWARMFESHVAYKLQKAGQTNTYLVSEQKKDSPLYPNAVEMPGISAGIDQVFSAFKNSDLLHKAIRYFFTAAPATTFTIPSKG